MKETKQDLGGYKERFDKMYKLGYDLCWLDKEIPVQIKGYIQELLSDRALDITKSRVLDLGCGRGQLLHYLEQKGFNHNVGVDVSPVACRFAKQHTKQSSIIAGDGIKGLPFNTETFSLVTELTVLSSLNPQYWPAMLNEIHRVLKRGGFYISELFTREETSDLDKPLLTGSVIPRELDQVYGVTRTEISNILGRQFSIKECLPVNPGLSDSFFVLAQKL